MADFDVIIVGAGPAGVSAAFACLQSGLKVMLVDAGDMKTRSPALQEDFLEARYHQKDQWKWMIGEDYYALRAPNLSSPKLRIPAFKQIFEDFSAANHIDADGFTVTGSLALGGLSNVWGCGVARWSDSELASFPCDPKQMKQSYAAVSNRIGLSGRSADDLEEYFGVDEWASAPLRRDALHEAMALKYNYHRVALKSLGFRAGYPRVAVLSEQKGERHACSLSGNCMWGCREKALYNAADELINLSKQANFTHLPCVLVERLEKNGQDWSVLGTMRNTGQKHTLSAKKVLLAAGTLATSHLALRALNHTSKVSMMSCPTAAFILCMPGSVGSPRATSFGLGQLSFTLSVGHDVPIFGSTFSLTGIPMSEFLRHMPLRRPLAIALARHLLSSCLVGNIFLPGNYTKAHVRFDGSRLKVEGSYLDGVSSLLSEAKATLAKSFRKLGAYMLPGSFTTGAVGSDIHYTGTLPMKCSPTMAETNCDGEIYSLPGLHVVDGACLPAVSEKSHTLTIMANADRISRNIGRILCS